MQVMVSTLHDWYFAVTKWPAMLLKNAVQGEGRYFRIRGKEILRIEALSDAVFAFAVSLLVVSLEVPQNFHELRVILRGALPFFATISLLFLFWYQQYVFFRHYALNDLPTILLNMAYLALILFYLYPLKFLFSLLLGAWLGIDFFPKSTEAGVAVLMPQDFPDLVVLFSVGYAVIWALLLLMHHRALQQAAVLQLSPYEMMYTKAERRGALWNVMVGFVAILLVWMGFEKLSGICYLCIPILLWINNRLLRKACLRMTLKKN